MIKHRSLLHNDEGALALEATLVFPFFVAFIIALQSILQLVQIELALRSSVYQSVELTATHLEPIQLLYRKARAKVEGTRSVVALEHVLEQLQAARSKMTGVEDGVEQVSAYVPSPVLELIRWEKAKREQLEQAGQDEAIQLKQQTFDRAMNAAFTEVVYAQSDGHTLRKDRFKVVQVRLPDLEQRDDAYFTIEAEYEAILPIPFVHPRIVLRAQSTELAWLQ